MNAEIRAMRQGILMALGSLSFAMDAHQRFILNDGSAPGFDLYRVKSALLDELALLEELEPLDGAIDELKTIENSA
jgi:hypothetical protein